MARTATMAQMIADVRWRADIEAMTTRHTDEKIARQLNQSIQALRVKVSDAGGGLYLKPTTPTTMTAGALAGYAFGTVPHPADAVGIYGIDVTAASGDIRSLEPGSWSERNAYQDRYGNAQGFPVLYVPYNIGAESTTSVTAGKIALFPAPDAAYTYSIWYLPTWVDIAYTNTTYVFDGYSGWEEWPVWDTVIKIAARDADMQNVAAIANGERQRVWDEVVLPSCRIQKSGPKQRIDVVGMRRQQSVRRWP